MSSSVDERIVSMQFNNRQFESGVKSTQSSLADLKKSLNFEAQKRGLAELNEAGKRMNLASIANGVENISGKFSAMGAIALGVLGSIGAKAATVGLQMAKSLAVDPIAAGFADYNEKLSSVQTIMNATGASLQVVNGYFNELDTYADKTIFNLTDMTGAFAKFTNAGVDMKTSIPAIKGIANMVALAGQGAGAASIAMYNLSQSIGNGFLTTTDYKSLNLANVATKEWKEHMVEAAVAAGTLKKVGADAYTLAGSKSKDASSSAQLFNEKLSEGWASADVLLSVLNDFGDETTAIGAKALSAAQDVKSLPMMFDTLKAAVGTGWTSTFEILLGNVTESTKLFTGVTKVLGDMSSASSDARNKLLQDWKDLGGREDLIQGLKNAFDALMAVIKPIKDAFKQIFPPTTAKQLASMTEAFREFTKGLIIGGATADKIKRTFAGVFAFFSIGISIIKQVARVIRDLFGKATDDAGGGILDFTAKIGDWLVKVDKAIKTGKGFTEWFDKLRDVLLVPIEGFRILVGFIGDFINKIRGIKTDIPGKAMDKLGERIAPLGKALEKVKEMLGGFGDWLGKMWQKAQPIIQKVGDFMTHLGQSISEGITKVDWNTALDAVNTGLFAGLLLLIKGFITKLSDPKTLNIDFGGGLLNSIKGTFGELTGTLKTMQASLKADTLLKIAGAIGILTASVVVLSLIDSDKLSIALIAMTTMFVELGASMAVFEKIASGKGVLKMPFVAASMILLGTAILILSAAVKILAGLDWDGLAKGLVGVTVLMGVMVGASKLLSKNAPGMLTGAAGLIAMAVAIRILAGAVLAFSDMSWEEMAQGFAGMATALVSLQLFSKLASANKAGLAGAAGIVVLGAAMKVVASAVKDFSGMNWDELGRGIAAMAASLLIIGLALKLIPPSSLASAVTLVIVAGALLVIADAVEQMSGLGWEEIGKGMTVLAGSLLILAGGLFLMTEALPGALALIVAAGALAILTPVLVTLSGLSWEEILKGLAALAGVFLVLGVAGLALTPVLPMILLLAVSVGLIGAGFALAGLGVLAFATGLTLLGAATAVGVAAVTAMLTAIIALIPLAMKALAEGIVAFAQVIADSKDVFVAAMTTMLLSLVESIGIVAPVVIDTLVKLIMKLITTLANNVPKFVEQGLKMIKGILTGIGKNIAGIVEAALTIIAEFIKGVGKGLPKIIDAGFELIVKFIEGLTKAIDKNSERMGKAGGDLAVAIIKGMAKGLMGGLGEIMKAAKSVATSALEAAKHALGIHSPSKEFAKIGEYSVAGFVEGLKSGDKNQIESVYENMINLARDAALKANDEIVAYQAALAKEYAKPKKNRDKKKIAELAAGLAQARKENAAANTAYGNLTHSMIAQKNAELALADQHDITKKKLEEANKVLVDATKTRDDYNKSLDAQYSTMADIGKDTQLTDYIGSLREQVAATLEFSEKLNKLRTMGLDDRMYKKLLGKGIEALPFVDQIIAGGESGIQELNNLGDQLENVADGLGDNASSSLYQAGVDAAAGIVAGLESQQKAIEAQMAKIAEALVKSINAQLAGKPATLSLMTTGAKVATALATGLNSATPTALKATSNLGTKAINTLSTTMAKAGDSVSANMELTPTIRPVLDLSDIKTGTTKLNEMLTPAPLAVGAAYSSATTIAASQQASLEAPSTGTEAAPTSSITFVQNNTSPQALSSAEIYRQTKNQLSVAKGELPT